MDWIIYTLIALLGLSIGSFLNVVIYRLPRKIPIGLSRSKCPNCEQTIGAYDNIPLISYLILAGRCRRCKAPIHWRYPLVEALNAGAYVGLLYKYDVTWTFAFAALLATAMIAIIFIDVEHYIIPDKITLPGIAVGLVYSLTPDGIGIVDSLIGALVGGGALYGVALLGDLLFKKESMGGGDIKMATMLGAFIGWQKVLLVFLGSAFIALVASMIAMPFSKKFREHHLLPYGPFLALAGIMAFIWGDRIIAVYVSTFLVR